MTSTPIRSRVDLWLQFIPVIPSIALRSCTGWQPCVLYGRCPIELGSVTLPRWAFYLASYLPFARDDPRGAPEHGLFSIILAGVEHLPIPVIRNS